MVRVEPTDHNEADTEALHKNVLDPEQVEERSKPYFEEPGDQQPKSSSSHPIL